MSRRPPPSRPTAPRPLAWSAHGLALCLVLLGCESTPDGATGGPVVGTPNMTASPAGTGALPLAGTSAGSTGGVGATAGTASALTGGSGGAGTASLDAGTQDATPTTGHEAGTPPADAGNDAGGGTPDAGGNPEPGDDLCEVGVHDGTTPRPLSLSGNTFAHDPTMIEADGVYYRFWTGDNIPSATSTDLMRWNNAPAVYRNGLPSWSRDWLGGIAGQTFNFPWAPDVSRFNGQFHIYSSFSAKFGDNISCITHLTTADIASGNWTDHGPVICTEGNERYNAIDADLGLDTDGTPWLAFGSFWDGIMLMRLDDNGARVGDELQRLAWAREIEAPVLFRRCGYYYLFVTWGLCCPGAGRSVSQLSYRVAVGRSDKITGPYLDRSGRDMVDGGGTLLVQGDGRTFAAAGHSDVLVSGDTIYHLYHGYRLPSGGAELRIVEMPFDADGWPVPAAGP